MTGSHCKCSIAQSPEHLPRRSRPFFAMSLLQRIMEFHNGASPRPLPAELSDDRRVAAGAQDMLDQYGAHDSKLASLDSALKDAVQMVRVSDQRITYLRKMHALLLLKRCDSALALPRHHEGRTISMPAYGKAASPSAFD